MCATTALAVPMPTPTPKTLTSHQKLARTHLGRKLLAHRDSVLSTAKHYGLNGLYVFGSVARGSTSPSSDIDLVVTQVEAGVSLFELGGVLMDLRELLEVEVDIGLYRSMKSDVQDETREEMLPL